MAERKPIVNPKKDVDELAKILNEFGNVRDLGSHDFSDEELKKWNDEYEKIGKENEASKDVPGILSFAKDYISKAIQSSREKADLKRIEKDEETMIKYGISEDQMGPAAIRLSRQLQYENKKKNQKTTLMVTIPTLIATGFGLTHVMDMFAPEPQLEAPPVVKVTYLGKDVDTGAVHLQDVSGTAVKWNLSVPKVLAFAEPFPAFNDQIQHFVNFDGGFNESANSIKFNDLGGAKVYVKGLNTNNTAEVELTYEQVLQQLPLLLDGGITELEIRTQGYIKAGTNPVYRNIAGDQIVNKTAALLNQSIDPAKYTLNISSEFDQVNKTAKHGVKFIAKEGSGVTDIPVTGLSKEMMAQVNDILIDNHAGDDYQSMLETISIWEGVNGQLAPVIDYYTNLIIQATDERDENNSYVNELSAHLASIIQNITKLGYINGSSYSNIDQAVADLTDKALEQLKRDLVIEDKKLFRFVYESLPQEYKQFMVKEGTDLDAMLDGSVDNVEFERFNASISGKLTEKDANGNIVNVTGQSLFNATGTENDYNPKNVPREAIELMTIYKLIGEGALSAVPNEIDLDKDTANMLYQGLGAIDARNAANGTATQYQKQFMSAEDYARLFNNNNSDGEAAEDFVKIKVYQAPGAPCEVIYKELDVAGTATDIPAVKSAKWLEAAYEIIGEGE